MSYLYRRRIGDRPLAPLSIGRNDRVRGSRYGRILRLAHWVAGGSHPPRLPQNPACGKKMREQATARTHTQRNGCQNVVIEDQPTLFIGYRAVDRQDRTRFSACQGSPAAKKECTALIADLVIKQKDRKNVNHPSRGPSATMPKRLMPEVMSSCSLTAKPGGVRLRSGSPSYAPKA